MELKVNLKKVTDKLHKFRYPILIVLIGLVLMRFPVSGEKTEHAAVPEQTTSTEDLKMEENLSRILGRIQGAGDVYVMLTTTRGEEIIYQTDQDISKGTDTVTQKSDTVTVVDASRNETGLVRQINSPVYLGAIVVCSGADDPTVRLSIVEAVSKVTGIGANKISVLKMK